jgi:hypothetical protein
MQVTARQPAKFKITRRFRLKGTRAEFKLFREGIVKPKPPNADLLAALHEMAIQRVKLPDEAKGVTEKICRHCGSLNVGAFEIDPYTWKPGRKFECLQCKKITEMRPVEFCIQLVGNELILTEAMS